jgi:hypothetical protein
VIVTGKPIVNENELNDVRVGGIALNTECDSAGGEEQPTRRRKGTKQVCLSKLPIALRWVRVLRLTGRV